MLTRPEFKTLLGQVGIDAEWHQAKPPQAVSTVKVIVSTISDTMRNDGLVNAYGVHGVQVQVDAAVVQPIKFDRFKVGTESYTVDTAIPQHERVSGAIISYTCYCKGR